MVEQYKIDASGKTTDEADRNLGRAIKEKDLTAKLGKDIQPVRSVFRGVFNLNPKAKKTSVRETHFEVESESGWLELIASAKKGHNLANYDATYLRETFYDLPQEQVPKVQSKRTPAGYDGGSYSSLDRLREI